MHARELIDLAGILAARGRLLIAAIDHLPEAGLDDYWTAAKCRLDRWGHSLKRFSQESKAGGRGWYDAHWPAVEGLLEEILTGEILTRVWSALAAADDLRGQRSQAEPLAQSVLIGHLEARHRVLLMLVNDPHLGAERALRLDRLRRRCDRWSDMLIGYLAGLCDVGRFAVDAARAQDFAADLGGAAQHKGGQRAWALVQASLAAAFRRGLQPSSPNADLNARIAAAILACFPPQLFDSTGLLRTLHGLRMTRTADDAQGLLQQILAAELPQAAGPAASVRPGRLGGRESL